MREGLETIGKALASKTDLMTQEQEMAATGLKAIASLMDTYNIGDDAAGTSDKAFKAVFDIVKDRIEKKYNYTIDETTGTVWIRGKPLSQMQPDAKRMQKELSEVLRVGTAVLRGPGGTRYQNQINALQAMLNSLEDSDNTIVVNLEDLD